MLIVEQLFCSGRHFGWVLNNMLYAEHRCTSLDAVEFNCRRHQNSRKNQVTVIFSVAATSTLSCLYQHNRIHSLSASHFIIETNFLFHLPLCCIENPNSSLPTTETLFLFGDSR